MSQPTTFLLLAQYGPVIPITEICDRYLGLDEAAAKRKAVKNDLPFPVFKARDSQKAPWLVYASDLAEYLDSRHISAAESHPAGSRRSA